MAKLYQAKFFADVDSSTGQMTPETLINCIKLNNLKDQSCYLNVHGWLSRQYFDFYKLKNL